MEIIYYVRQSEGIQINDSSYSECFFIPSENIMFARENYNGVTMCNIVRRDFILKEAASIEKGEDPYKDKRDRNSILPTFLDVRRLRCDDEKIKEILKDIKDRDNLQEKVQSEIEELLRKI